MTEFNTAPGSSQSTEEEFANAASEADVGSDNSTDAGVPSVADGNFADAGVPPASDAGAPNAGEKPKTTLELFDEIFRGIDFKNPSSLIEKKEELVKLSKSDPTILRERRKELDAVIAAVDFNKREALEEEADSVLLKYGRDKLDALFSSANLAECKAAQKELINLVLRIDAFTSNDATSEQRSKHRQLLELSKLINSQVDRLAAGPPELTSWKKEEAELLQKLLTIQSARGSGRSTLLSIRDKLSTFFSDPRKAEFFKHSFGDMARISALIDQLDGDPDILDVSDPGLVALVDTILEPNVKTAVKVALVQLIEDRKARHSYEFDRVAGDFAKSKQNIDALIAILRKGVADNIYSQQVLKVLVVTLIQVEEIKQKIAAESTDVLQGRINTATYSDLLTATEDSKLSTAIKSAVVGEVKERVENRAAQSLFSAIRASRNIVDTLPHLDKYANTFPVLSRARQVLDTVINSFTSEKSKAEFFRTSFPQDIRKLAAVELQKVNLSTVLRDLLLEQFGTWADAQPKLWAAELEEQKEQVGTELKQVLESAIPIWVQKALRNVPKGILTDSQIQSISEKVASDALQHLSRDLQTVSLQSIRSANIADDLAFIRTNQKLRPQLDGRSESLFAGILDQNQNRDERSFGIQPKASEQVSAPLWHLIKRVGEGIFNDTKPFLSAAEFAVSAPKTLRPQGVVLADGRTENHISTFGETQQELQERKQQRIRDGILAAVFARLASQKSENIDTVLVQQRTAFQKAVGLSHVAYVAISKLDENLFAPALQDARELLVSIGVELSVVEQSLQQIRASEDIESLIELSAGVLFDEAGKVHVLDSRMLETTSEEKMQRRSISHKGSLLETDKLGEEYQWYANPMNPRDPSRFDAATRVNRLESYLANATISYGFFSSVGENVRSFALQRAENADLFKPKAGNFDLAFKLNNLLDEQAKNEIVLLAKDTSVSLEQVKNAMIVRICESQKTRELFSMVNSFVAEQVQIIAKNARQFLSDAKITAEAQTLTPIDWYNILLNLVAGKFSQKEPLVASIHWDNLAVLKKKEDFNGVLALGKEL